MLMRKCEWPSGREEARVRSIRSKIVALVTCCVVVCSLIFGIVATRAASEQARIAANAVMSTSCESEANVLNEALSDVKHAVDLFVTTAADRVTSVEALAQDSAAFNDYQELMQSIMESMVSPQESVLAYYLRFSPNYFSSTSGCFYSRPTGNAAFESLVPTDITAYDSSDMEHVGWYYQPIRSGKPVWMDLYWNANTGAYTISYVAPIYVNGVALGVAGVDLDLNTVLEDFGNTDVYETGYCFLLDASGHVVYHPTLEMGVEFSEHMAGGQTDLAQLFSSESSGTAHSYSIDGESRQMVSSTLANGMNFVLSASTVEIEASATQVMWRLLAAAFVIAVTLVVAGWIFSWRLVRPLEELTAVAGSIEAGNLGVEFPPETKDEVGVLNRAIKSMVVQLQVHMLGLSQKAYRDSLTGVKNKAAYADALERLEDQPEEEPFGIVVVDVNNLKTVNDEYGHDRGDACLKRSCMLICSVFDHSPVYRYGGDEFVVILHGHDLEHAEELIVSFNEQSAQINEKAENPWDRVDAALGVAYYEMGSSETADDVFKRADKAMYADKLQKKGAAGIR